ncbi:3-dehydroquinate synthase [Litchfieldia salsa]|uniref:3-dehydroquinate synthase n=1 Tax=Litchfieldia salsa TaxID=930152 RepID=A0A1H0WFQ4_9BACI|nr:3-dehydroquinate synthase [Litchfieldia salsa]SDP89315.1 3-dehydroquinate synthase [Litchfieldia salsa]
MEVLQIKTQTKDYPLYVGSNISINLPEFIKGKVTKILIITDENVSNYYLKHIEEILKEHFPVTSFIIPSGEKAKSIDVFYKCHTHALQEKLDRSSLVIALGGGVVGDLAGFVAATYMRGVPFIQMPTTLLAHDSAVGGKVAINHELGKNMIGVFNQPESVVYDISLLKTLPESEMRSGFAEVIKHALIKDVELYNWLKKNVHSMADVQGEHLQHMIISGIKVKADVVYEDENETGIRAYLNFGHTLGHAIEAELGYGQISHGDAVAIGMLFAIKVSENHYGIELNHDSFLAWFEQYGFPISIPSGLSATSLLERMKRDKKSKEDKIRMVLLREIGTVELVQVNEEMIRSMLGEVCND